MSLSLSLEGKRALICGASAGIGRATALQLAEQAAVAAAGGAQAVLYDYAHGTRRSTPTLHRHRARASAGSGT